MSRAKNIEKPNIFTKLGLFKK